MGRLEWFRDLKTVFLGIQEDSLESPAVLKTELMRGVRGYAFDLQDGETYFQREKTVAFSFEEVYGALEALTEVRVTWDQVIDAIFQIGVTRAKHQSKAVDDHRSPLVTSHSVTSILPPSSAPPKPPPSRSPFLTSPPPLPPKSSTNTLDLSFPDDKLTAFPSLMLSERRDTLLVPPT